MPAGGIDPFSHNHGQQDLPRLSPGMPWPASSYVYVFQCMIHNAMTVYSYR